MSDKKVHVVTEQGTVSVDDPDAPAAAPAAPAAGSTRFDAFGNALPPEPEPEPEPGPAPAPVIPPGETRIRMRDDGNAPVLAEWGEFRFRPGDVATVPNEVAAEMLASSYPFEVEAAEG